MNLRERGTVLYTTSIDLSRDVGPSINEREFSVALSQALGDRVKCLIPTPAQRVAELEGPNFAFSRGYRHPVSLAYGLHQVSHAIKGRRLLHGATFDLLVVRLGVLPAAVAHLARHSQLPVAVKTMGAGAVDSLRERGGRVGRMLTPLNDTLVRRTLSRSVAVDVCTKAFLEYHRPRLSGFGGEVRWIENATNTERFRPNSAEAARATFGFRHLDPIVGFVGGRPWDRGGTQILRSLPALLAEYPQVGAVIVGGSDTERLSSLAGELGIRERCVFTGQVNYEQVPEYINAFDVCVSFDDGQRLSKIGNSSQKVRQYVACGKPVVTSIGGNASIVEHGLGSAVDASDGRAVSAALLKWLGLSAQAKVDHSVRAFSYARQHLSITATVGERLDFWSEALDRAENGRFAT